MAQVTEVTCIEDKGYKITVGKVYQIVKQDREYYFVENDNDKVARYSKTLFEGVKATPARTERDMIASIGWSNRNVTYTDMNMQVKSINSNLSSTRLSVSCGIHDACNIEDLIGRIANTVAGEDDYTNLQKAILTRFINEDIKARTGCAMAMVSCTTNVDEDMLTVLDELSDVRTEVKRNPNSGNDIKAWIFYTRGR